MPQAVADRASRRTMVVTAAVVVAVAALLLVALSGGAGRPGRGPARIIDTPARVPPDVTIAAALESLTVLRDWDRQRAAAWRSGDPAALRRLYTAGSRAGERDVAMLRRWADRGIGVRGMAMQVFDVDLRARSGRRIVLVVTDRLVDPVAVGDAGRWQLPRDRVTTRRLEFRRTAGRWLLAGVYDLPARPLASTSTTVGSANS